MATMWLIKTITLTLLFVIVLIFGFLPFKLVKYLSKQRQRRVQWPQLMTSLLNCFAGGVFLGTTFLHLLPEVREGFEEIWVSHKRMEMVFPMAEFITVCGFFLVVFAENAILAVKQRRSKNRDYNLIGETASSQSIKSSGYGTVEYTTRESGSSPKDFEQKPNTDDDINYDNCPECKITCAETSSNDRDSLETDEKHSLLSNEKPTHQTDAELPSLLLLLALCLHTVFEGLALGLLSKERDIWELFMAIAIHKTVISFSLGLRMAEQISDIRKAIVFMLIFACMCPLGGVVGTIITEAKIDPLSSLITSSVLQGIATGTFLHVIFFEVLYKELAHGANLWNVLVTFTGYGVMALLTKFLPS